MRHKAASRSGDRRGEIPRSTQAVYQRRRSDHITLEEGSGTGQVDIPPPSRHAVGTMKRILAVSALVCLGTAALGCDPYWELHGTVHGVGAQPLGGVIISSPFLNRTPVTTNPDGTFSAGELGTIPKATVFTVSKPGYQAARFDIQAICTHWLWWTSGCVDASIDVHLSPSDPSAGSGR
jgi:hypothetical protein